MAQGNNWPKGCPMKKIFLVFIFLFSVSAVLAETIVLKSGKVVEGKILEETDEYVKIDTGKSVFKIRKNLIKKNEISNELQEAVTGIFSEMSDEQDSNSDVAISEKWSEWYSSVSDYEKGSQEISEKTFNLLDESQRNYYEVLQRNGQGFDREYYRKNIDILNGYIEEFENLAPPETLQGYHLKVVDFMQYIKKAHDAMLLVDNGGFYANRRLAVRSILEAAQELNKVYADHEAPSSIVKITDLSITMYKMMLR